MKNHLKYIIHSVDKFLACRDMSKGFIKFKCPICPIIHKFPLTCKSKLCPSCGFKYSRIWSLNIMKHILNIEHRHVLFTIPKECRQFFFYDRNLLSKLSAAVNEIFKFSFHNISKKNLRKIKSQNFPKNISLTPTSYTMDSFQLYIPSGGILNGIRIFMPLFLWEDLLKILTSRKWGILMRILLPVNGSTMSSKLFRMGNIMTVKLKKSLGHCFQTLQGRQKILL